MTASVAAQQTSAVHFDSKRSSAAAILIVEEESMSIKVERGDKGRNFGCQTYGEGTQNSPIVVAPFQNGQQGSQYEPICLEEGIVAVGDRNHPICVDDTPTDDPEVVFQLAIEQSLIDLDGVECFEVEPDDPKGKKPKRERRSRRSMPVQEVGESSNRPPPEPDAYCSICMEPKFKHECLSLRNCSHLYCSSCVGQYVEAKVEENVTSIGCPDPTCKDGYLEPEMCRLILKPEVFNRWGAALCEALIGSMKFYCPFKDCSALLIDEGVVSGGDVIRQSECPHCFRLFCAQCKVPWHVGVSCEEFAKLGADEREREDIMLKNMAKDCKWQRCPSCKFYVERISGCMFILCRCGYRFCYGCATEMKMDHYCTICKR